MSAQHAGVLARRVRLLSPANGRKTDEADALSLSIATGTAIGLHVARLDDSVAALRALIEHCENLVSTRQDFNRLHVLLTELVLAGLPHKLTADIVVRVLRAGAPPGRPWPYAALLWHWSWSLRSGGPDRRVSAVAEQSWS